MHKTSLNRRILLAIPLLLALIVLARLSPSAGAATITVNTTQDTIDNRGDCSLREAIIAVNENRVVDGCSGDKGENAIMLPPGTYVFKLAGSGEDDAQTGDLDITGDLTLNGDGHADTIIKAAGLDRVFHLLGGDVTISDVTITGGGGNPGHGGGIAVDGASFILSDSRVIGNASNGSGGGIHANSSSEVTILNSRIGGNEAYESGGGLYSSSSVDILGSTIADNEGSYGGGLSNSFGEMTIRNSLISGNLGSRATSGGGGIYSSGDLIIGNTTISGNSTIHGGGGLIQGGTGSTSLYNVTITDNAADSDGINGGDGGGIFVGPDADLTLKHTIIAGNFDPSAPQLHPDCSGALTSQGFNLIQDVSGCVLGGNNIGNKTGMAPLLDALGNNGGPTLTHALQPLSPAIDAGNSKGCRDENNVLLTTDQRGYVRPVEGKKAGGVVCDIGAFEALSPGAPTATNTAIATSTPTSTATNTPTRTPTATNTPTITATPTNGPSPTPTNTPTVTATATDGPSPTPTDTPTVTATATDGPSPTSTNTPTVTATATDGPSPTPTATATDGPSPTPTATATEGPSPTPFVPTHWLYVPITLYDE